MLRYQTRTSKYFINKPVLSDLQTLVINIRCFYLQMGIFASRERTSMTIPMMSPSMMRMHILLILGLTTNTSITLETVMQLQ